LLDGLLEDFDDLRIQDIPIGILTPTNSPFCNAGPTESMVLPRAIPTPMAMRIHTTRKRSRKDRAFSGGSSLVAPGSAIFEVSYRIWQTTPWSIHLSQERRSPPALSQHLLHFCVCLFQVRLRRAQQCPCLRIDRYELGMLYRRPVYYARHGFYANGREDCGQSA
jgi:hypothetical protein